MIRQGPLAYKAVALPGLALLQITEFVIGKVDGNDHFYEHDLIRRLIGLPKSVQART